jgi:hypothetical protein
MCGPSSLACDASTPYMWIPWRCCIYSTWTNHYTLLTCFIEFCNYMSSVNPVIYDYKNPCLCGTYFLVCASIHASLNLATFHTTDDGSSMWVSLPLTKDKSSSATQMDWGDTIWFAHIGDQCFFGPSRRRKLTGGHVPMHSSPNFGLEMCSLGKKVDWQRIHPRRTC